MGHAGLLTGIFLKKVIFRRKLSLKKEGGCIVYKILVLNFGGTSSKVAIYHDEKVIADETIRHSDEDMAKHPLAKHQLEYRKRLIQEWIESKGERVNGFDAIACIGAYAVGAYKSGTYIVDEAFKNELLSKFFPDIPLLHGTRLVLPIALEFTAEHNIPIYITDPVSVDELQLIAKISGFSEYNRVAGFQPLSHKAVARKHAAVLGKEYKDCRFIIAHLGSGISIGAHSGGRVIEVNDCGHGYGPFSPERAGTISARVMMEICFSGKYTQQELYNKIVTKSGIYAHLGTKDMREVERRINEGDKKAALVYEAMAYSIAKEIGQCFAVLSCNIDALIFTGGSAYSDMLMGLIRKYVGNLGPIAIYPGELENEALALGAYRVLSGQEEPVRFGVNSGYEEQLEF